jgi:hypothetical protein
MANLQQSSRHLSGGWFSFWAAVLLILPNCGFSSSASPNPNLDPGTAPHSGAVFCDFEVTRRCATPEDLIMGTRMASAAVALVAGQGNSTIGLLDSPAALADCGGSPAAIVFKDKFPRGTSVCVNCGEVIPALHANAAAVCQARCHDTVGSTSTDGTFFPQNPPSAETVAFCNNFVHVSTNVPLNGCFGSVCTTAGMLLEDFADPRRIPEGVDWVNLNGVSASGGTLTRTAPTTGFSDAGASSSQLIARGDGYLEFTATETTTARTAALSSGPPPATLTFNDMDFGLLLLDTGEILALENGLSVGNFGLYVAGDKFRLKVRDNFDGTGSVSYARIIGPCVDGSPCNEAVFHTSANPITYPVRVDAMFREQGGTITDARIVRIR